jgi:hypothetical protein
MACRLTSSSVENATQRGTLAGATAGTIAGTIKLIAKAMIGGDASTFVDASGWDKACVAFRKGSGIGERIVLPFLAHVISACP